jgi:hypothetical protein
LRLIAPNNPAGQSLTARRPTFTWHASNIPMQFGDWQFELRIEETATGQVVFTANTNDTTITIGTDLETNESYRWRVTARLPATGDSVQAASAASFVILSDANPLTDLMLTPFPTPFPLGAVTSTCVWFDLRVGGKVLLDVSDLTGHIVKTIFPGPGASAFRPQGRYGRPFPGATTGCNDEFSWNGTDRGGRIVPPGIYLIRLLVDGRLISRQHVVFKGR